MRWNIFAENFRCLETKRRLDQEGGFARVQKSAQERTASWVRIVNGIEACNRNDREDEEHRVARRHVAKARPRLKLAVTLSSISVPVRERKWIDINPDRFCQDCFTVSQAMSRLLRHDPSVPREDDGALRFYDFMDEFKAKFDCASQWPINDWISFLEKGGGPKKRFQYCLNPNSCKHFLYFRAIQGHSGANLVDPALQDNVLLPEDFTEYIYHIAKVSEIHSIIRSGLIPGRRSLRRDRQSVYFTAVNQWTTIKVWKKFDATWTCQGLRHTKILGDLIKTVYWCN